MTKVLVHLPCQKYPARPNNFGLSLQKLLNYFLLQGKAFEQRIKIVFTFRRIDRNFFKKNRTRVVPFACCLN